jgi:hypothetical protein
MSCEHVEVQVTSGVIELRHDETDSLIHWFPVTDDSAVQGADLRGLSGQRPGRE